MIAYDTFESKVLHIGRLTGYHHDIVNQSVTEYTTDLFFSLLDNNNAVMFSSASVLALS